MGNNNVADCGSGIGRISNLVLIDFFKKIDLIDPVEKFLNVAKESLENKCEFRLFCMGIQNWLPDVKYDCIWVQWALLYLTDEDIINFLNIIKFSLNINGFIFIKDNVGNKNKKAPINKAQYRSIDNSVNRVYKHYLDLFNICGLILIESIEQKKWDENLLPVYTFILKSKE